MNVCVRARVRRPCVYDAITKVQYIKNNGVAYVLQGQPLNKPLPSFLPSFLLDIVGRRPGNLDVGVGSDGPAATGLHPLPLHRHQRPWLTRPHSVPPPARTALPTTRFHGEYIL